MFGLLFADQRVFASAQLAGGTIPTALRADSFLAFVAEPHSSLVLPPVAGRLFGRELAQWKGVAATLTLLACSVAD